MTHRTIHLGRANVDMSEACLPLLLGEGRGEGSPSRRSESTAYLLKGALSHASALILRSFSPGSSYFLPMNELTALYINLLLSAFGEDFGYFVVDERQRFCPARLARFARSLGFRMQHVLFSRTIGAGPLTRWLLKTRRQDLPVPTAVGLERHGEVLA